ncbi:MAG: hypothetical protein AA908_06520 [Chlorobi bacterium NICIL-2]|jgi:GT2 family glycosyltransferase|nr:MAG: hypothetical protein AA908_06520 [Chlorobi bacterium NICIL-2]
MSWTFDVIIPTYENAGELQRCLDALEQQTFGSFRVFICIDGESAAVRQLLAGRRLPFAHHIVSHPGNEHRGRNATRNLALPYLEAPFLAMLDSDVVPAPEWLAEHYRLLCDRECASVGDIRFLDTAENVWARYIQHRGKNKYCHGQQIPPYYLTTGNLALPTRFFQALGGQDERMRGYGGGDTEFALRLEKTFSVPVIFNANALGYSTMNKTLAQALAQMEEFGAVNLPLLLSLHPEERRIFGLKYLLGQRWFDRVLRSIARSELAEWLLRLLPFPVASVERAIVHFAVFSAIARGWERHRSAQAAALQ